MTARPWTLAYRRSCLRALHRMQPAKAEDIVRALERIAVDPRARHVNVGPLKGIKSGFRLRVGDWRASYTLDAQARAMDVFEIAPRGGAYR